MTHDIPDLVYIDEYGLQGSNFYWDKHGAYGLTKEDILAVGLTSNRVQASKDIIVPLQNVNRAFEQRGFQLYVKEGYRSKELYELVYQKRSEKFGKAVTDQLLNMADMPHAKGLTVDVALWDPKENKEIYLRNKDDGRMPYSSISIKTKRMQQANVIRNSRIL